MAAPAVDKRKAAQMLLSVIRTQRQQALAQGGVVLSGAEEERAAKIVTDALKPFTKERGGPLQIELLEYVPARPNVKISLLADKSDNPDNETVSFVGAHMDVVPANPESWNVDQEAINAIFCGSQEKF